MVILSAMYSSHNTDNVKLSLFSKAAILIIAALFPYMQAFPQTEYSNWLLGNGSIASFVPSFNLQNDYNEDMYLWPFAISDNNGRIILHGYLESDEKSEKRFVIKNVNNEIVVSEGNNIRFVKNIVYCKTNGGQYYVAVVLCKISGSIENLHIYRFDAQGVLKKTDIFDSAVYKSFLAMVPCGEDVELLAYNNSNHSIETFKLTESVVVKDRSFNTTLGKFMSLAPFPFKIRQTIDGSLIFARVHTDLFEVSFNHENGDIAVKKSENCLFLNMAISPNEKYLLTFEDNKLIGYELDPHVGVDLSKRHVLYEFSLQSMDYCWAMQTGIDGNIYLLVSKLNHIYNIIIIKDVEGQSISPQIIDTNPITTIHQSYNIFPQIMRRLHQNGNPCSAPAAPRIIPE